VPVQPLWLEYPSFLYTTAGLNGSALDLARFVAAIASGDLLSEASRGEMWGNAQLADGSVARMGPYGVALGWLTDDRAGRSVWMGGAESGAVRYFVDEDLTVAVLTNLMGAGPYALVDGAAKAYLADDNRTSLLPALTRPPAVPAAACGCTTSTSGRGPACRLTHVGDRTACTYMEFAPPNVHSRSQHSRK
jgi:CubicO group peptidase (beta-lactamase class C family)